MGSIGKFGFMSHQRRDYSVVWGLALGVSILGGAVLLGGIPWHSLINPEAILIVFGGTLASVLINFSSEGFYQLRDGFEQVLDNTAMTTEEWVHDLSDMAAFIRRDGILALQPILNKIDDPFIQKGLQYIVDNRSGHFIQHALATDIEISFRADMDKARVFEAAGGFAPTMGIIGAVIGLIQVAHAFDSPDQLTHGVASAFTATLYGVALSNLLLLPIAGKLKQQARERWFQKTVLMEGIMSIYQGDHPLITEEKLSSFVTQIEYEGASPRAAQPSSSESAYRGQGESAQPSSQAYQDIDSALDTFLGSPTASARPLHSERPVGLAQTAAARQEGLGAKKKHAQLPSKNLSRKPVAPQRVSGMQSARETSSFKAALNNGRL